MFDLLLKGGRVIDPAQDLDETLDVAFADGRWRRSATTSAPPMPPAMSRERSWFPA